MGHLVTYRRLISWANRLTWEVQAEFQMVRWGQNTWSKKHYETLRKHSRSDPTRDQNSEMCKWADTHDNVQHFLSPVPPFIAPNGQDSFKLPQEVNQPTHKTDHSPPTSYRVKYEWRCTYTPPISSHSRPRDSYCTFPHLLQYNLLPELWKLKYIKIYNIFEVPIHPNNIYTSIPSHIKHIGCPITKTNELLLFRGKKKIGVRCDHRTKDASTMRGHDLQFRVNSTRQAITVRNLCESKIKLHHH